MSGSRGEQYFRPDSSRTAEVLRDSSIGMTLLGILLLVVAALTATYLGWFSS